MLGDNLTKWGLNILFQRMNRDVKAFNDIDRYN